MIDFFYHVINDSAQDRTQESGFWKSCEKMQEPEKNKAIREHMDEERPYSSGTIKAISFKSAMRKIAEDMKEHADFLTEDDRENLYLTIDRNYLWCGHQLDINVEGLDTFEDTLRLSLEFNVNNDDDELDDEEVEEIRDEIIDQTEEYVRRW